MYESQTEIKYRLDDRMVVDNSIKIQERYYEILWEKMKIIVRS